MFLLTLSVLRLSEKYAGTLRRKIAPEYAYSIPLRPPNPRQTGHRKRGCNGLSGRLGCVRYHRQSHELGLMRALPGLPHPGIYRMPLVYGYVKLKRSLAPRIAGVCKLRCRTCLLFVGRCEGALAANLEPNIHVHARTPDIRNFVWTHRWATILDLQMYRAAWLEGVEWAESSSCKQERETGQKLPRGTPS